MEKQNLSSLIWSTADDVLRGMFKPSEYGRIILPFVVLRRLDCVLEPQKDKAFELHEKYKKKLKDFNQVIQSQLNLPFFNVSKFDVLAVVFTVDKLTSSVRFASFSVKLFAVASRLTPISFSNCPEV